MSESPDLKAEYETLRAELLQLYRENNNLTYATAIAGVAIVLASFKVNVPAAAGVAVWEAILVGISWKLAVNYRRIYRLGSYIKIVHEMKCDANFKPGFDDPAWHLRSRSIGMKGLNRWKWGSGAKAEGHFLRILGLVGLLFAAIATAHQTDIGLSTVLSIFLAIVLCVALYWGSEDLYHVEDAIDEFEAALLETLGKKDADTENDSSKRITTE